MIALCVSVVVVVAISAFCSLSEAALHAVPWSWIERLRDQKRAAGDVLLTLRAHSEKPLTAILTLNTIATTAGAAVAGAAGAAVFGSENLWIFIAGLTLLVLAVGEILPKSAGMVYSRPVSAWIAAPVRLAIVVLRPVTWAGGRLARLVAPPGAQPVASHEDLCAVLSLARLEGGINPLEELSINNILSLDCKFVSDIMTPRIVVFSLPAQQTVAEARGAGHSVWPHSRIPVYDDDDPENIVGIVYRREVLEALANDQDTTRLGDLMKPVRFVLETMTLDRVLVKFLESRMHLFVVLDEYGGVSGVVSLEDVLEEILGKEIVDETDEVVDMRELAKAQRNELLRLRSSRKNRPAT